MALGRGIFAGLLAVALAAVLVVGGPAASARDGQSPVFYPGTAQIPPHGSAGFVEQPPPPGSPQLPAAPPSLSVMSQSDQPTTATYDGMTLTITAPMGYIVQFVSGCIGDPGNPASCPKTPCGQLCIGNAAPGIVTFTTTLDNGSQAPLQAGGVIPYPAGWNLVAGFTGAGGRATIVDAAGGPLYTFQAGDTAYETLPSSTPLTAGRGYWVYFSQPASIAFPQAVPPFAPVAESLPAGQFVLIGDPFPTTATVSGADVVYVYDPATGYQPATTLQAGQGAWAFSAQGATITISSP